MYSIRSYHTQGIGAEVTLKDDQVHSVHLFIPAYDGKFVILVADMQYQGTGRLFSINTDPTMTFPNPMPTQLRDVGSLTVERIGPSSMDISYAINTAALNAPEVDFSPSLPIPAVVTGTTTLGRLV